MNDNLFSDWSALSFQHAERMPRVGVGYGLGGLLLYNLLLYKTTHTPVYRERFVEILEMALARMDSADGNMYPDLTELFYLLSAFRKDIASIVDITALQSGLAGLLEDLTHVLVAEKSYGAYMGAFNFGYFNLLLNHNDAITRQLLNEIKVNLKCAGPSKSYFQYTDEVSLYLAHGLAFYLVFISNAFHRAHLEYQDMYLLREHAYYIISCRLNTASTGFLFPPAKPLQTAAQHNNICYGEIGIIYALTCANAFLEDPFLGKHIDELLQGFSQVPTGTDNSLLYGIGGLSLITMRIHQLHKTQQAQQLSQNYQDRFIAGLENSINALDTKTSKAYNFFEGKTGELIVLLARRSGDLKKINSLLTIV